MSKEFEVVAKRYNRALMNLAQEKGEGPKVLEEIDGIVKLFSENEQLFETFKSPAFTHSEKERVLSELSKKMGLSGIMFSFLRLLLEKDRIEVVGAVAELYRKESLASKNSVEVEVETAIPLSEEQLSRIQSTLEEAVSLKVIPNVVINEDLLAGLRVKILGRTLESTLESNFEIVKQELLKAEA